MKIKTFGVVDERSLEQLKRCMIAGEAEYGVLCADHHPGYSQPIGGAIAYEGYVSPSGVGSPSSKARMRLDSNCCVIGFCKTSTPGSPSACLARPLCE